MEGYEGNGLITEVMKRSGETAPYDTDKIYAAIYRAMESAGEGTVDRERDARKVTTSVYEGLVKRMNGDNSYTPGIEDIQDVVENELMESHYFDTAKSYVLYRSKRSEIRNETRSLPADVQALVEESREYLDTPLKEFIHMRTYSRWQEDKGRRETWVETVDRYVNFMEENLENRLDEDEYGRIKHAILNQEVMPSMRLMWSAGDAARASNVAAYNCAFTAPGAYGGLNIAPNELKDFGEIMYILMCGAGVGFSVENKNVQKLPPVWKQRNEGKLDHVVQDSKEGWANAVVAGMETWIDGYDVDFDYSKVRPSGAVLKTMGGRSSGPDVLKELLGFYKETILGNQGRRLQPLDVHDLICKQGDVVVVGGVRRSALISLSDLHDEAMRHAKDGSFFLNNVQRSMANNSAVYESKPGSTEFMEEWLALAKSGSGERGIFNRYGLEDQLPARRWGKFQHFADNSGTNPCGEINLRSKQFCNLTEVVARPDDTEATLLKKIELATILGTYQSTLTDFPYLSDQWRDNCEEERLLGVSITGLMDSPAARNPETLRKLRDHAIEVNKTYAAKLGINSSTCITCTKPSGTVSQLVDSSPGLNARLFPFSVKNIRISSTDPLLHMMRDQGYPFYPENRQNAATATTFVLPFPIASPKGAIHSMDLSSIEQLEMWKNVKENYTEHNPSVTINIGKEEWLKTGNWIHENFDSIGGLAFLPRDDHVYNLAPFEEITEEQYHKLNDELPKIDYSQIFLYEQDDYTSGALAPACEGPSCEVPVPK